MHDYPRATLHRGLVLRFDPGQGGRVNRVWARGTAAVARSKAAPLIDFRTDAGPAPLGQDFLETVDELEFKQDWYRACRKAAQARPLDFVGRFNPATPAETIAADIRRMLGLTDAEVYQQDAAEALYSWLANKAGDVGILVFRNEFVGNDKNRKLSVAEFRGVVICDPHVPAIFINGADAPAAWAFTLAHEMALVWLGESGISDASPFSEIEQARLCNAVAGELLVPRRPFLALWDSAQDNDEGKLTFVRSHIRVSALMIARRALELGRVSAGFYQSIYQRTCQVGQKSGSGADFRLAIQVRNGKAFSKLVASMAMRGAISLRDAADLLDAEPAYVLSYAKQQALSP